MSFVPVVRTTYQLVCDGCGFERYPVYVDDQEDDIAAAIDFDCWNEVEDGIYCGDCSWRCRCGKAFRGNPPPPGMCEECERNQYGRLIDVTKDWEPCPGSGRELFLHEGPSTAPCLDCPATVPIVMTAGKGVADAHLRRRRFSPIAFEPGTRIRNVWTGAVAEVVKHDPRTGTTQLRNTGTGTVQTMNSHNNTLYVAVREAE